MRRAFGWLMDVLEADQFSGKIKGGTTLGELAAMYDEPIERVMDALDANKERRGQKSYR